MDFFIKNTEKHLLVPLDEVYLVGEYAVSKMEEILQKKSKSFSEEEKNALKIFCENVKKLSCVSLSHHHQCRLPLSKEDVGEKPNMTSNYKAYMLPTTGRAQMRSVETKNPRLKKLGDLANWPFKEAAALLKVVPTVLFTLGEKQINIFINLKALEKMRQIENDFAKGTFVVQESTAEDKFTKVKSYAVYAKHGKNEGFLNAQCGVGTLAGAVLYESLGGALSRAKSKYRGSGVVVEVETKIRALSPENINPAPLGLAEAIAAVQKSEIEDVLKSASQRQLLDRLSALDGAEDVVASHDQKPEPQKRRM